MVDALGLLVVFEITEGQRHDSIPAEQLVVVPVHDACWHKAYDSDLSRKVLANQQCVPVIPNKASVAPRT